MPTALGIDLASARWRDTGTALVTWTGTEWTAVDVGVLELPPTGRPDAADLAARIDRFCLDREVRAVALDGPQGWRDSLRAADDGVMRACERSAATQGKTGVRGTSYPRTQLGWIEFSIGVFEHLLARPHVELANAIGTSQVDGGYLVAECFPTSGWRSAGLRALPGKARRPDLAPYAAALVRAFALPPLPPASHDELQAVVCALAAAAVAGGPARATPHGLPARREKDHWVEGLIWDAVPNAVAVARPTPLVVIVTGPPATGKTTLATRLARELGAPILSKDLVKEALFDSLGSRDRAWSREVGAAAFATLFRLLEQQLGHVRTVIVEANFAPGEAQADLASLLERYDARVVQVYCDDDPGAIAERYRRRAAQRHPGHADLAALPEVVAGLERGRWRPLDIGGDPVRVQFPPSDATFESVLVQLRP